MLVSSGVGRSPLVRWCVYMNILAGIPRVARDIMMCPH